MCLPNMSGKGNVFSYIMSTGSLPKEVVLALSKSVLIQERGKWVSPDFVTEAQLKATLDICVK